MMDFYNRQDRARKKTRILLSYFAAAIVLLVAAINTIVFGIYRITGSEATILSHWLRKPYWIYVTGGTLLFILAGTLLRMFQLRKGGSAVARMVGARRVTHATAALNEQRLVNVVEEMAIASGMPVPNIFIMDGEKSINAFVAGYNPTKTVLVVTRGALEELDRDELQGVIGHEFSHIFNGDMRINLKLVGILAGILAIGQMGIFILRSFRSGISIGGSRERAGGKAVILMAGAALAAIGYIGLFFGRLIKAAVSRQREFLADASSVQFTRYPAGLAGALRKIKDHGPGSLIANRHAEEMSHMCFGETVIMAFGRFFATHPPLDDRIHALDPALLDGTRDKSDVAAAGAPDLPPGISYFKEPRVTGISVSSPEITESVGNHSPVHMDYAVELRQQIPHEILQSAHAPREARAVIYALLLPRNPEERTTAVGLLEKREDPDVARKAANYGTQIDPLGTAGRLPLIDLSLPALNKLTSREAARFLATTENLVTRDRKVSLFEYVLQTLLRLHLKPRTRWTDKEKFRSYQPVLPEIAFLLSVVTHTGGPASKRTDSAYRNALRAFTPSAIPRTPLSQCTVKKMNRALNKLVLLSPLLKKPLIDACADLVLDDGRLRIAEAELLRAIAKSLDCPMPPLIPSEREYFFNRDFTE
jgi:Zn-dependent protease with chaperone function